ncbi:MAG: alpha-mannosidase [Clostridia bacterium]|nr:alpha-mannosidase [Clostridia bacterium]
MDRVYLIGNAHLDPVWLWTWKEGFHEIKATFQSALDRMNEFEGYVFTCACASYYEWVEENAPEMFREIQRRVKEGRWKIVGGMWVQPDMNSLSGESIARQLLMSQRYFREKFGVTVKTGYNVDTFGHNGQLPQILNLSGIVNYVWMRPMMNENANIPEGALLWEGIDGSKVTAFRIPWGYCGEDIVWRIEETLRLSEKYGYNMMCFYGVGNHGGGPTIKCLNEVEAWKKAHPDAGVNYADPDSYFKSLEGASLPAWSGELQHHASGCYSTHADSKMQLRKTENKLLSAETFGVIAEKLTGMGIKDLSNAWKTLLFNEFHDLLGGCSIKEALDEMITDLKYSYSAADHAENFALQRLSWAIDTVKGEKALVRSKENHFWRWNVSGYGTPVVVFNPHAFEVTAPVSVYSEGLRITDDDGNDVPVQKIRAGRTNGQDKWDTLFMAKVPPVGYRVYWMHMTGGDKRKEKNESLIISETAIENRYLRAEISPATGEIEKIILKASGKNVLKRPARTILTDITHADTWAHNIFTFDKKIGAFENARLTIKETGPVRVVLRAESTLGKNTLIRDYILTSESDTIEVKAKAFMETRHAMLKVCLAPNAENMRFLTEIPFGAIGRTPTGEEEPSQRWIAGVGENAGVAILNTGANSSAAPGDEIRQTFLNTSAFADHYGQETRDEDMEFMQIGRTDFTYQIYPFEGKIETSGVQMRAALLNEPLSCIVETYHEGPLPRIFSGISMDKQNIMLRALKKSENKKGTILRLYESMGLETYVHIDISLLSRSADLSFKPFEIKTLFVPDEKDGKILEIDIPEFDAD